VNSKTLPVLNLIDPLPMQVECSWCHTVMTFGTVPVSHGICSGCIAKLTDCDPQLALAPNDIRD